MHTVEVKVQNIAAGIGRCAGNIQFAVFAVAACPDILPDNFLRLGVGEYIAIGIPDDIQHRGLGCGQVEAVTAAQGNGDIVACLELIG